MSFPLPLRAPVVTEIIVAEARRRAHAARAGAYRGLFAGIAAAFGRFFAGRPARVTTAAVR